MKVIQQPEETERLIAMRNAQVGGWCAESKEVTFLLKPSQISVLSYPLQLLEKVDEPICTDRMPMLNSGFNGEREVKL